MAFCNKAKELSLNYGVEVVNLCIAAYITFEIFESKECKAGHKGTGQKATAVVGTILMAFMLVKNFFLTKSMETAIARSKAEAIAEAEDRANAAIAEAEDRANAAIAEAKDMANAAIAEAIAQVVADSNASITEAEDRGNTAIAEAKADADGRLNKAIAQVVADSNAKFTEIGYGNYVAVDFHDIDRTAVVDDPFFDELESQKNALKKP
jgi:F0F1-type ATP synthase membrane subunit b/b'